MCSVATIGILAYGSLISDPGTEIGPLIEHRVAALTPFCVEFARFSRKRGYSATVVPHPAGNRVAAQVLILSDSVSLDEARNLLWRREIGNEGTGQTYREKTSENAVLVRDWPGFCHLDHVLYTDFNPGGKIPNPDPRTARAGGELSRHAAELEPLCTAFPSERTTSSPVVRAVRNVKIDGPEFVVPFGAPISPVESRRGLRFGVDSVATFLH